jgi:outer membrane biosynthesis protein TonB
MQTSSRLILTVFTICLIAVGASGQGTGAVIRLRPEVPYPDEAKETGLEGVVAVPVLVGRSGKVKSVGDPEGPDGICQHVSTPDVKALRSLAAKLAEQTTFVPGTLDGNAAEERFILRFTFVDPSGRRRKEAALEAQRVAAAPKGDHLGVRIVAPGEKASTASPDGEQPKIIRGGVLNGHAKKLVRPEFPRGAHLTGAFGAVNVQVVIDEKGKIYSAEAVNGDPLLARAATVAACESEFTPTLLSGMPVKVRGIITYNFVP